MADAALAKLLDFSQPFDLPTYESIVSGALSGNMEYLGALETFRDNPDAYSTVDKILSNSTNPYVKFYALQVLDKTIAERWNILPDEQREGIRQFIVGFVVSLAADRSTMHRDHSLVKKADHTLVSIAKHEWPHNWRSFVDEVCSCPPENLAMMENCLTIMKLLMEEIFEFGELSMTSRWIERKRAALQEDFHKVMRFCTIGIFSQDTVVIIRGLEALQKYIPHVSYDTVFEPNFLGRICELLAVQVTAIPAIRCCTEIAALRVEASLRGDKQKEMLRTLFAKAVEAIGGYLPPQGNTIEEKIQFLFMAGGHDESCLLEAAAIFFHTIMREQAEALRAQLETVTLAHRLMLGMTYIETNKELFKTCIDHWWAIGNLLANSHARGYQQMTVQSMKNAISPLLESLRSCLIRRMAKPEEVLITTDENGDVQTEFLNDVETVQMYVTMREVLVFLTTLDHNAMEQTVMGLLARQLDISEYSPSNLNALCWSFGAMSGALSPDNERSFFVAFIRSLLSLVDKVKERQDRAVIASGVMYGVGQYPRFLNAHPRFLRTVLNKLFEFMKEPFPGVKDMAVDTFIKIGKSSGHTVWEREMNQFGDEMISRVDDCIAELTQSQALVYFEGIGTFLAHAPNQEEAIGRLLNGCNTMWNEYVSAATSNVNAVLGLDDMRGIVHLLRIFDRVARTSGNAFIHQMRFIFTSMQSFYLLYSQQISGAVASQGPSCVQHQNIKYMRTAKREILKVIEHFIANAHTSNHAFIASECLPTLFGSILSDYSSSTPMAREPQVLMVLAAATKVMRTQISHGVSSVLEHTWDTTVQVIVVNTEDNPELRVAFFELINNLTQHCFDAFITCVTQKLEIIDGILWAAKHVERGTMTAGLEALAQLLERVAMSEHAAGFFESYWERILIDILVTMLDKTHASGFRLQCRIIACIFRQSTQCTAGTESYAPGNLSARFKQCLTELGTLTSEQIDDFISKCYSYCAQPMPFQVQMADFMIEVQVWGADLENKAQRDEETRLREEAIEGLARPAEAGSIVQGDADELI